MTSDSRLISVPIRIIPLLGDLSLLDDEGIETLKDQLNWIQAEVSERRRKELAGNNR